MARYKVGIRETIAVEYDVEVEAPDAARAQDFAEEGPDEWLTDSALVRADALDRMYDEETFDTLMFDALDVEVVDTTEEES